jgi:hypothetical protein
MDEFDGVVCDSRVQIRRVTFTGYKPDHFRGHEIKIYPYDRASVNLRGEALNDAFLADENNRS